MTISFWTASAVSLQSSHLRRWWESAVEGDEKHFGVEIGAEHKAGAFIEYEAAVGTINELDLNDFDHEKSSLP
jgi:hypothetical protein